MEIRIDTPNTAAEAVAMVTIVEQRLKEAKEAFLTSLTEACKQAGIQDWSQNVFFLPNAIGRGTTFPRVADEPENILFFLSNLKFRGLKDFAGHGYRTKADCKRDFYILQQAWAKFGIVPEWSEDADGVEVILWYKV